MRTLVMSMAMVLAMEVVLGLVGPVTAEDAPATPPRVICTFDGNGMFTHGSWKGQAVFAGGAMALTGEKVTDKGGVGREEKLDLSGHADGHFELVGSTAEGNAATHLVVQVLDGDGTKANWVIPIAGLGGADGHTAARCALPLGEPNKTLDAGKEAGVNWADVRMWQVLGYYQGKTLSIVLDELRVVPAED